MFFDQAKIHVTAGKGGNGCISFRRERHVPRGGPDGGDGGRGGDVVILGDPQLRDLQSFTYKVHFKAASGEPGSGARKHGADGADVIIPVPLGTQVWSVPEGDQEQAALLADMTYPGQRAVVARGGVGGRGNARFVNSVRQAPRFAEFGEEGESRWLRLSLRLMADAGLTGLPNAGKSSLLRRLSNAKPKVAAYPFTTLEPMLGVVDWSGEGDVFTLADVPGLLEGASEGLGLGHEFLAHLERCELLLHVVDVTGYYGVEPLDGFRTILDELSAHAASLAAKPQVVVLNKIDTLAAESVRERVDLFVAEVERLRQAGHPAFAFEVQGELPDVARLVWPVSAVTGAGLKALAGWIGPLILRLRRPEDTGAKTRETDEETPAVSPGRAAVPVSAVAEGAAGRHVLYRPVAVGARGFVVRREGPGFVVTGRALKRLVSRFDLTNEEAIQYLGERLDRLGVYSALRAQGAQPGDEVDIEGYTFEFQ
jgi:GTP-binding protein